MSRTYFANEQGIRQDMMRLQQQLDSMNQRKSRRRATRGSRVFPSIIISSNQDSIVVRAEVPGMALEDLDISVSGDTLTIRGNRSTGEGESLTGGWYHRRERNSGEFSRAVRLPADVDGGQAQARYLSGVVVISLPLKEEVKPRQIPVRVVEG